ncbi:unnamed protein product, partial [Bubo scandiacus]
LETSGSPVIFEQSTQEHLSLGMLCSLCTAVPAQGYMEGGQQSGDLICPSNCRLE